MKTILITIAIVFSGMLLQAQDMLILTDGSEIETKIIEIGDSEIKYKKSSNLNGPYYTTSTDKVHQLKFENGSIESYSQLTIQDFEKQNTSYPTREKIPNPSKTGKYLKEVLSIDNIDQVFEASEYRWYGLDFSNAKLINAKKVNKDLDMAIKHTYCRAWIEQFSKTVSIKQLNRVYKAQSVVDNSDPFQESQLMKADDNNMIAGSPQNFDYYKLLEIIKNYELNEDKGIGYVMIVENLNKYQEIVTIHSVYFDIETREIFWAAKTAGTARGSGMTNHWNEGIHDSFNHYYGYYSAENAKYKKKKKKRLK